MNDTAQALAAIAQRLDRYEQRMTELHALLLAPPRMSHAARQELARLVRLLLSLRETFRDGEFLVSELTDAANADMGSPLYAALADIVDARAALDPKRCIGKFLAKHAGTTCAGLYIERVGEDHGSALWAVRVSA